MRQKTHHVLIGAFVLLAAVLAVGGALLLGAGSFGRKALVLETYIKESVSGLDVGAHVRFRGVKLGSVTEISWTSVEYDTDDPLVLVRFEISPTGDSTTLEEISRKLNQHLENGLRARLASAGLTGALYLEADLYEAADERYPPLPHDWTPKHRYVPSIPSTITQISSSIETVLANLQQTDFNGLIDELRGTVQEVREKIRAFDVASLRDRSLAVLDGVERSIAAAAAAVDRVGAGVDEVIARARERIVAIDGSQVTRTLTELRSFTQRLEPIRETLASMLLEGHRTAADLGRVVRTKDRDLDAILGALRRTTASIAGLASTLEEYPSLLLLGNPPPQRGTTR